MRLWLLIALVGCKTDETMYPIIPGGPGGPGSPGHDDAGVVHDGNDGGMTITGKVCLITDARDLATCAAVNAAGLAVQLGTKAAVTAVDGSFTIASPQSSNLEWQITGTSVVTTDMSYSTSTTIPVLTGTTYMNLEADNGVIDVEGEGAILARVVQAGAPVAQATATTEPLGANSIFYDGNSVTQWNPSEFTGPHGMVWAPNIAVGGATLTVMPMSGSAAAQLVTGIPVIDRGITIVIVELP